MNDRREPRSRPPDPSADWALFLDIDGTMLDLAPTPDAVEVPPTLPACLAAVNARLGGALALVSGRALSSIDALLGSPRFAVAGRLSESFRVFLRNSCLAVHRSRPVNPALGAGRRLDTPWCHNSSMKIAIELNAAQSEQLRAIAAELGVAAEELAHAAVADLLSARADDFEAAAARVLGKNRELYRRLAQ
jgi:hypothetical protein